MPSGGQPARNRKAMSRPSAGRMVQSAAMILAADGRTRRAAHRTAFFPILQKSRAFEVWNMKARSSLGIRCHCHGRLGSVKENKTASVSCSGLLIQQIKAVSCQCHDGGLWWKSVCVGQPFGRTRTSRRQWRERSAGDGTQSFDRAT